MTKKKYLVIDDTISENFEKAPFFQFIMKSQQIWSSDLDKDLQSDALV